MFSGSEVNLLLGSLPLALVTADENRLIVGANRAAAELFEYDQSEMIGNPVEMLIPEDLAETHSYHYRKYVQQPETRAMGDGRDLLARKKDGSEFPVEVGLTILTPKPKLFLASILDISLRKKTERLLRERQGMLEMALNEAKKTLEEEVSERTRLEERQRLGRELHDSLSQNLYGIGLGLRTSMAKVSKGDDPLQALDYCLNLTEASLVEMRALLFKLRPKSLDNVPLEDVLMSHTQAVTARTQMPIEFSQRGSLRKELDFERKYALFRIATEALHNCVKHARAKNVKLSLVYTRNSVTLEVSDDGSGFDVETETVGHGMSTMQERVEAVDGQLVVNSNGSGTSIRAVVPLR